MKLFYLGPLFFCLPLIADWKVGDRIQGKAGEYLIEAEIGNGSTGKVFQAKPIGSGPSIAIRQIIPNPNFNETSGDKILEGALRIKNLQSEDFSPDVRYLQKVIDAGKYSLVTPRTNEPEKAILTELLNQPSALQEKTLLYQIWSNYYDRPPTYSNSFTTEQVNHSVAIAYFVNRHLLHALAVLARHRLVHNDIKPQNILYRTKELGPITMDQWEKGEVEAVLCDFDGVIPLGESTLIRTQGFSAPEREISPHRPTLVSDLYGMGQTINELLFSTVLSQPWSFGPADNYRGLLIRHDLTPLGRDRAHYLRDFALSATDSDIHRRIKLLNEVGIGMFRVSLDKGIHVTHPTYLPTSCARTLSEALIGALSVMHQDPFID